MRLVDWVPALSVTLNLPCLTPTAIGLHVTLIVQLDFAASEVPQLLVWAKLPVVLTVMPVRELVCRLVSVTACDGLVVPTCWLPNVRLGGLMMTCLKNACMSLAVAAAPGKLVSPTASLIMRNRFSC